MFVAACASVPLSCAALCPLSLASQYYFFCVLFLRVFNVNSWDGFSRYTFNQPFS